MEMIYSVIDAINYDRKSYHNNNTGLVLRTKDRLPTFLSKISAIEKGVSAAIAELEWNDG